MNKKIKEAIRVFNEGGIVIFPTDTAFGIGCRVDKPETIKRLYTIRKRPQTRQTSLLVSDIAMVKNYVTAIPDGVEEKLIKPYWPGAVTIILLANKETVPSLVRAGGETVGIRMPDHTDILSLIFALGVPILGPSANFHGEKTPFSYDELDSNLVKLADFVLPGVCERKSASTVIDTTVSPWRVVREGEIRL